MKKLYFILLLIGIVLLTGNICLSMERKKALSGKVIVIDPGHGGMDGGTNVGNIYEKDINLEISLLLKKRLEECGVNVLMTRDGDYDLSTPNTNHRKKSDFDNRIKLINESNADMYLSIHINYLSDTSVYGIQTFYSNDNKQIANVIQNEFKNSLNSPLDEKRISNSIYMYKHINVPGVLIECGFLGNNNDRRLLLSNDYREKLAKAIINSLIIYYS